MSLDDDILAGLPGVRNPLSHHTLRVAELLRLRGADDRWKHQCQASDADARQRRERHALWAKAREQYALMHITADDASKTSPGEGWTWAGEPVTSDGSTRIIMGWFPPEFTQNNAPYNGPVIPFSSGYKPTLADCYFALAVVHDAERQGPRKLEPFAPDDMVAWVSYYAQQSNVVSLSESDRVTLDDCLARVEADLKAFESGSKPIGCLNSRSAGELPWGNIRDELKAYLSAWELWHPEVPNGALHADLFTRSCALELVLNKAGIGRAGESLSGEATLVRAAGVLWDIHREIVLRLRQLRPGSTAIEITSILDLGKAQRIQLDILMHQLPMFPRQLQMCEEFSLNAQVPPGTWEIGLSNAPSAPKSPPEECSSANRSESPSTGDPKIAAPLEIVDSLLSGAELRRQREDDARQAAEERKRWLTIQADYRKRLENAFNDAYVFPTEERLQGRKPCADGFRRWADRFLALGTVARECDTAIERLRFVERIRAVAQWPAPAAMKFACALVLLAVEGDADSLASALEKANRDVELRRFILWMNFILDSLWHPFAADDGIIRVSTPPDGTSREEYDQAERALAAVESTMATGQSTANAACAEGNRAARVLKRKAEQAAARASAAKERARWTEKHAERQKAVAEALACGDADGLIVQSGTDQGRTALVGRLIAAARVPWPDGTALTTGFAHWPDDGEYWLVARGILDHAEREEADALGECLSDLAECDEDYRAEVWKHVAQLFDLPVPVSPTPVESLTFIEAACHLLYGDSEVLPSTRTDGFGDDVYWNKADYAELCRIVCSRLTWVTAKDWWDADNVQRGAYMRAAIAAETAKETAQPASTEAQTAATPPGLSQGKLVTPTLSPASADVRAAPIEIFFSYSHKDERLRDQLANHLSVLRHQGLVAGWHDRKIGAGNEWEGEIDQHLNAARVILLLVSADFLASRYCYDLEMKRAMQRHEEGEARVIPVILRPCDWHAAPFGKLNALPTDGRPVTEWKPQDKGFADVAKGIRTAVTDLAAKRTGR